MWEGNNDGDIRSFIMLNVVLCMFFLCNSTWKKGAHEDYFCLVSKEKITPSCWAHVLISRWTNGIRMGSLWGLVLFLLRVYKKMFCGGFNIMWSSHHVIMIVMMRYNVSFVLKLPVVNEDCVVLWSLPSARKMISFAPWLRLMKSSRPF